MVLYRVLGSRVCGLIDDVSLNLHRRFSRTGVADVAVYLAVPFNVSNFRLRLSSLSLLYPAIKLNVITVQLLISIQVPFI